MSEDILDHIPLRRKFLPCLYCHKNRQVVGGFCSKVHSDAYFARAMDRFFTASDVGSIFYLVMKAQDDYRAARKKWRQENPGKRLYYR